MKSISALLALFLLSTLALSANAFNLWTDIQQQTTFPIGQAASAGTAVNLRDGSLSASALAELANYRMFSAWYGGTMLDPSNGKMTDTGKIGINVGYFLTGFINQPPLILRNLVVGPAVAMSLISTPRKAAYLFDFNFRFGGDTALPKAVTPSPAATLMPPTASRLNLFYEPILG